MVGGAVGRGERGETGGVEKGPKDRQERGEEVEGGRRKARLIVAGWEARSEGEVDEPDGSGGVVVGEASGRGGGDVRGDDGVVGRRKEGVGARRVAGTAEGKVREERGKIGSKGDVSTSKGQGRKGDRVERGGDGAGKGVDVIGGGICHAAMHKRYQEVGWNHATAR